MRHSQKRGIRHAKNIKSAQGRKARYNAARKAKALKQWASNPRNISGWGLCNKASFVAYWCQWFPKSKVLTRWNKCLKLKA